MAIHVDVDLEIDEIISSCRSYDKTKLLRELLKNMSNEAIRAVANETANEDIIFFKSSGYQDMRIPERIFNEALMTLGCSYMTLSVEDQTTIENIAKKY